MARPKESNEQKVKKVYPHAKCKKYADVNPKDNECVIIDIATLDTLSYNHILEIEAWSDALTQIRKAKIKAAKDKRKPAKVPKEIKKHTMCTMYPTDKAIIVKGFGSVQKFLDSKVNEYKLTIKTN